MELPIKVPLGRPIKIGDQVWSELLMDEPDLDAQIAFLELEKTLPEDPDDIDEIDKSKVMRFWISRMADVSEAVAGKLKGEDQAPVISAMNQIFEYIQSENGGQGGTGNGQAA